MDITRYGSFVFDIDATELSKGLRPVPSPRDSKYLVECDGAVGLNGLLQVLDDLEAVRLDTALIADGWPYPQIFVFAKAIIVCGQTKIYEWVSGALDLKLTVTAGNIWSAIDYHDFVYLSNGVVAVLRNAGSKEYSTTTDYPAANAACDYNGRAFLGAPDVSW